MMGNKRELAAIHAELKQMHEHQAEMTRALKKTNELLDIMVVKLLELTGQTSRAEAWLVSQVASFPRPTEPAPVLPESDPA